MEQDQFFLNYKPHSADPTWKSALKTLIGLENSVPDERYLKEKMIQNSYRKNVIASKTSAGLIEISVKHKNPEMAAGYANDIMLQIRELLKNEEKKSKEFRLSYLAQTLADALQDMEDAQINLKNYALKNSTAAQENFISGSLKLDNLRIERNESIEYISVLAKLSKIVKTEGLDISKYEALRLENPLVDDVNFRRILGMSETISAWSWPDLETILNKAIRSKITENWMWKLQI